MAITLPGLARAGNGVEGLSKPSPLNLRLPPNSNEGSWSPLYLTDLALWVDAKDYSSFLFNGSKVMQWSDKSGRGRNLVQADNTVRPDYSGTGFNGSRPSVTWPQASNTNRLTTGSPFVPLHVATVVNYNAVAATWNQSYQSIHGLVDTDVSPTLGAIGIDGDVAGATIWNNNGTPYALDGAAETTTGLTPTALPLAGNVLLTRYPSSNPSLLFQIGCDRSFGGRGWSGAIAEVVVTTSVMSSQNVQRLEGYLAHRWGVSGNLPANHPFKLAPP